MTAPYKHQTTEHAESVGNSIGQTLVESLLRSTSQAEALRHLITSIQILFEIEHHQESAIGGFLTGSTDAIDMDGQPCKPGYYELAPKARALVAELMKEAI